MPDPRPIGRGKSWRAFRTVLDGKFEILKRIGTGGMGTVVQARDRIAGRLVAIKMPSGDGLKPSQLERFMREGEIMASLDHPGIVRVFSCGEADGKPYLVCELVEGAQTLDALTELPVRRRVEILRDVSRALGYAHGRGVTHRDLKPDNVLIDADGRARVTDFGLALSAQLDRLTKTGMHMGTPGYMPPELFKNAKATGPFTDTWALGAMLYEVISGGRRPFPAATVMEMAVRVRGVMEPLPDDTPRELAAIAERALSPDPQRRYPDGEALARALDAYLASEAPSAPARRGAGAVFVVAALLVLVLGGCIAAVLVWRL